MYNVMQITSFERTNKVRTKNVHVTGKFELKQSSNTCHNQMCMQKPQHHLGNYLTVIVSVVCRLYLFRGLAEPTFGTTKQVFIHIHFDIADFQKYDTEPYHCTSMTRRCTLQSHILLPFVDSPCSRQSNFRTLLGYFYCYFTCLTTLLVDSFAGFYFNLLLLCLGAILFLGGVASYVTNHSISFVYD